MNEDSSVSDDMSKSHSSGDNSASSPSSSGVTSSTSKDGIVGSQEERWISIAKFCFLFLLLAAALAVGCVVYVITSNAEAESFQVSFEITGHEVIDASNENVIRIFQVLEDISLRTTTHIIEEQEQGSVYPPGFVTLPQTERQLAIAREASEALVVGYVPTVDGKDYQKWSQYTEENRDWMVEAWNINPTSDLQAEQELISEDAPLIFPKIWDLYLFDKDDNRIHYNSSTCGAKHQTVPARVEQVPEDPKNGPASPIWLLSPPPNPDLPSRENFNMRSSSIFKMAVELVEMTRAPVFSDICSPTKWFDPAAHPNQVDTIVVAPVFENFDDNATIVGHYYGVVPWKAFFEEELIPGTDPVVAVISSSCGHTFTFEIHGHNATYLGEGDIHFSNYHDMVITAPFGSSAHTSNCEYTISVFPTSAYEATYISKKPLIYMIAVFVIFTFTSLSFLMFDCLVQRRQKRLVITARKQGAIVSSLFPNSIQKKLMEEMEETGDSKKFKFNKSGTAGIRHFLNDELIDANGPSSKEESGGDKSCKPIADLFPKTTVMFADITNFTAWSSTREPSQVFTLLESIYHEFDAIAKRRRVFKVEVVGDCYVAVAGLPDPRKDHAVVMAKFANDCLNRMKEVTQRLEVELGPDTAELAIRVGLHSGPVVAGVLRGDKSRFQLFGDTMNTASRMESNGVPNHVQMSQETANLLIEAGKGKWLVERNTKIQAKGKGELTTYFLKMNDSTSGASDHGQQDSGELYMELAVIEEKRNRAAVWAVELMSSVLKAMVASRQAHHVKADSSFLMGQLEAESLSHSTGKDHKAVIDEVAECIVLPEFSLGAKKFYEEDGKGVQLDEDVMEELQNYVQTIASLYNENPFHNFEHASHVMMSVDKLLSRIRAPDLDANGEELHDHTYGITSDPLTQFACVFAALVHDVDHSGVPNSQLVKENAPVATLYKGKSVAEQNSFDIAWDLLLEPSYKNLRRVIYVNAGEFKRFRQLVINIVMATDIFDKDLKVLRNDR